MAQKLHPNIECLRWIVGKWESFEVSGQYPTVKEFNFRETIDFESIGQPLINYSSIARNYETGAPMHLERGFLKIKPNTNEAALIASQNSGISTIEEGSVEEKVLSLETSSICRPSFAKQPFVTKFQRKYWLEEDVLNYEQHMETENTPLQKHLFVKYRRIE